VYNYFNVTLFSELGLTLTSGSHCGSASGTANLASLTVSSDTGSRAGGGAHRGMMLASTVAPRELSQDLTALLGSE